MEKACGSSLIGGRFCEPSFLLSCQRCYNPVTKPIGFITVLFLFFQGIRSVRIQIRP